MKIMENIDIHSKEYYDQFKEVEFLFREINIKRVIEVLERKIQPSSLNDNSIRTIDDAYEYIVNWNRRIDKLSGIYEFLLKLNHPISPYNPERYRIVFQ